MDLSVVCGPPLSDEPGLGALTLPGFLREVTAAYAGREALVLGATRWTCDDLWEHAVEVARALRAGGVGRDGRVGVLCGLEPRSGDGGPLRSARYPFLRHLAMIGEAVPGMETGTPSWPAGRPSRANWLRRRPRRRGRATRPCCSSPPAPPAGGVELSVGQDAGPGDDGWRVRAVAQGGAEDTGDRPAHGVTPMRPAYREALA